MTSKYYQGYQPRQKRPRDFSRIEALRQLQAQQQQQQGQQQSSLGDNLNSAGKLYEYFKPAGSASAGGGLGTGAGQGFESFGAGGANGGTLGYDMNGFMGAGTPAAESSPSWYSSLFNGGGTAAGGQGGASSAAMSNPYGWAAAILGSANIMHNKGISPWNETIKGKAGGNLVDYYQNGRHGIGSKLLDKDGATGKATKGITDFLELDFGNALSNTGDSLKNLFKLKLF